MPERLPDDPLEALRGAWKELEVPDPTPENVDPETARAVEWMRAAWRELEAPPARMPAIWQRRQLLRRLPELGRLAAAAAILAIGVLALRAFLDPGPSDPARGPVTHRVAVVGAEEGDLVVEHGCVRLVMVVPEYEVEALDALDTDDKEN